MTLPQISWFHIAIIIVAYFAVYYGMKFIRRFLTINRSQHSMLLRSPIGEKIANLLDRLFLVLEPILIITISILIIFINPVVFGPIILVLYLTTFSIIKLYVIGKMMVYFNNLKLNQRLATLGHDGKISKFGRLGLHIRTKNGIEMVPYSHLLKSGFTAISGAEIGYQLNLELTDTDSDKSKIDRLSAFLKSSPFIRSDHDIVCRRLSNSSIQVQIYLEDERYREDMLSLFTTWGWKVDFSSISRNHSDNYNQIA